MLVLSNNRVKRRILNMADNIKETILCDLKEYSYFTLQVDESIYISNIAGLMCFVMYEFEKIILLEFFVFKPLSTTGTEFFSLIDNYINGNDIT